MKNMIVDQNLNNITIPRKLILYCSKLFFVFVPPNSTFKNRKFNYLFKKILLEQQLDNLSNLLIP